MSMDDEMDRQSAETNRIGAEGNRIGAETDRATAETDRAAAWAARDEHDKKVKEGRARKDLGQVLAYVLIVVVFAWGFYQAEETNARVCETANNNRDALINLVVAVDLLGRNLIVEGKPKSAWTADEEEAIKAMNEFTASQAELLKPTVC